MTRDPTTVQNRGDFRAKRFARLPFCAIPALAALIVFAAPAPLAAQACKPVFAIQETRFSPPQNLQRTWTAVLAVDDRIASRPSAGPAGTRSRHRSSMR